MVKLADHDCDGVLSLDEFLGMMAKRVQEETGGDDLSWRNWWGGGWRDGWLTSAKKQVEAAAKVKDSNEGAAPNYAPSASSEIASPVQLAVANVQRSSAAQTRSLGELPSRESPKAQARSLEDDPRRASTFAPSSPIAQTRSLDGSSSPELRAKKPSRPSRSEGGGGISSKSNSPKPSYHGGKKNVVKLVPLTR